MSSVLNILTILAILFIDHCEGVYLLIRLFLFRIFFIIIFIQITVICVLLSFFKSTVRQYIIQRVNNKMNVYEVFCFQNFEHIMPYQFPLDSRQIDECIGFKLTFMYLTSYFRVLKYL